MKVVCANLGVPYEFNLERRQVDTTRVAVESFDENAQRYWLATGDDSRVRQSSINLERQGLIFCRWSGIFPKQRLLSFDRIARLYPLELMLSPAVGFSIAIRRSRLLDR